MVDQTMIEGTGISLPAYADYSADANLYSAVNLDSSRAAKVSGLHDRMIGILQNTPEQGRPAWIQTTGKSFFVVGAAGVTCGDALMCGASGTLVTQTGTYPIVGMAADSYSAGDIGAVYLDMRGGPSSGVGGYPPVLQPIHIPLSLLAGAGDKVLSIPIPSAGTLIGAHAVVSVANNLSNSAAGYLTVSNNGSLVATMTVPVTQALTGTAGGMLPESAAPTTHTALVAGQVLKLTWVETTPFTASTGYIWFYFDTGI